MRPANVELLMGHDIGVSESYWRPTENELLDDYLKAVPLLQVNDNSKVLEKQIEQVNERNRQENIIINTRISEKDELLRTLKEKYDSDITLLKDAIADMQQLLKNPDRLASISKVSS
jgi:hypothetical protein